MTQSRSNIVLIGMPGAGKSTVGIILAKQAIRGYGCAHPDQTETDTDNVGMTGFK